MTPLQSSDILQEKEEVIKSLKKQKENWEETEVCVCIYLCNELHLEIRFAL